MLDVPSNNPNSTASLSPLPVLCVVPLAPILSPLPTKMYGSSTFKLLTAVSVVDPTIVRAPPTVTSPSKRASPVVLYVTLTYFSMSTRIQPFDPFDTSTLPTATLKFG